MRNLNETEKSGSLVFLFIACTLGVFLTVIIDFVSGIPIQFIAFDAVHWMLLYVIGALLVEASMNYVGKFKRLVHALPYLILFLPMTTLLRWLFGTSLELDEMVWNQVYLITQIILIFSLLFVFKRIRVIKSIIAPKSSEPSIEYTANSEVLSEIIENTQLRVKHFERGMRRSLIAMILLVVIGGVISFGALLYNEASTIRKLETERITLLKISDSLKVVDANQEALNNTKEEIRQLLNDAYGEKDSYVNLLEELNENSVENWRNVAMRITLAALTLILVQVLFHIYKYNQRQVTILTAHSELLKLYNETGADIGELRHGLLIKSDSSTRFGSASQNQTDFLINLLTRSRGSE